MTRSRPLVALVAVAILAAAPAVRAAPATATSHYDLGIERFLAKDYSAAARELSLAYALEPRRETLFAWAQSERLQGNCPAAVELYERYLGQDPPAAQVSVVRKHLAGCRRVARPPWYTDVWGDVLVGAGATSLGLATYFMVSSVRSENRRDAVTTHAEFVELTDEARAARTLSYVGAGVGVALVIGGVWRFARRPSGVERARAGALTTVIAPMAGDGVVGVAAACRF